MDKIYEYKLSLSLNGYEIASRGKDIQSTREHFMIKLLKLQNNLEASLTNVNAYFHFGVKCNHRVVKVSLAIYNLDVEESLDLPSLMNRFILDLNLPELSTEDKIQAPFIQGILNQTKLGIGFSDRSRLETIYMDITGHDHSPVDLSEMNHKDIERIKLSKSYYEFGVELKRLKAYLRKTIYASDEVDLLSTFSSDKFYDGYEILQ